MSWDFFNTWTQFFHPILYILRRTQEARGNGIHITKPLKSNQYSLSQLANRVEYSKKNYKWNSDLRAVEIKKEQNSLYCQFGREFLHD